MTQIFPDKEISLIPCDFAAFWGRLLFEPSFLSLIAENTGRSAVERRPCRRSRENDKRSRTRHQYPEPACQLRAYNWYFLS